jgi:hypothetical protein
MMEKQGDKITFTRSQALERAFLLSRLLAEDVYQEIVDAINKKDKGAFARACKKARIPDEICENLWNIVQMRGSRFWDVW